MIVSCPANALFKCNCPPTDHRYAGGACSQLLVATGGEDSVTKPVTLTSMSIRLERQAFWRASQIANQLTIANLADPITPLLHCRPTGCRPPVRLSARAVPLANYHAAYIGCCIQLIPLIMPLLKFAKCLKSKLWP